MAHGLPQGCLPLPLRPLCCLSLSLRSPSASPAPPQAVTAPPLAPNTCSALPGVGTQWRSPSPCAPGTGARPHGSGLSLSGIAAHPHKWPLAQPLSGLPPLPGASGPGPGLSLSGAASAAVRRPTELRRRRGVAARAAADDAETQMQAMVQQSRRPSATSGAPIKVVLNASFSADNSLGPAAVRALTAARGIEIAGAVDSNPNVSGQDLGQAVGLSEPLELPISPDSVMLFASIAQARDAPGVYVDLTGNPDSAFENVRQAVAFGLASVVAHCAFSPKQLSTLFEFCDKASTGCLVAPTLSVGAVLLQQAAASMAFHYGHAEIMEAQPPGAPQGPSIVASSIANDLSQIGRVFNAGDMSTEDPSRGALVGEGVRVHSLRHPGLLSSLCVHLAAPGQTLSLDLKCTDARAFMPGLLLAVRRTPRLKGLVYGLEKII